MGNGNTYKYWVKNKHADAKCKKRKDGRFETCLHNHNSYDMCDIFLGSNATEAWQRAWAFVDSV